MGNTSVFELGPDDLAGIQPDPVNNPDEWILVPGSDGAADTITINFTTPIPSAPGGEIVPNVDDINGFNCLAPWTSPPPDTPDAGIPSPFLSFSSDLELVQTGPNFLIGGIVEAEYELDLGFDGDLSGELVINFGDRGPVDFNCDGVANSGDLLLHIPEGTQFLAEFLPTGAIELEFETFVDNDAPGDPGFGLIDVAYFTHTGETNNVETYPNALFPGIEAPAGSYIATSFELIAESLQDPGLANIGDWSFEAVGRFFESNGDGQAFAYAESTAALGGDTGGIG